MKTDYLQDPLPIDEPARHPMWTEPEGAWGEEPIRNLRIMIARHLTVYDGRPNSETILTFFKQAYELSGHPKAGDTAWLIGQIIHNRYLATEALRAIRNGHLTDRHVVTRCGKDEKAIEGLAETFVSAVVKYV